MVTFLLAGLWHGAGWTFVFWGGIHGTGLALERARADVRRARGLPEGGRTAGARALQSLGVFAFVSFAWVFFRADSIAGAFAVLWRLVAGLGSIGSAVTLPIIGLVILGPLPHRHARAAGRGRVPLLQVLTLGQQLEHLEQA
jgi:alginate O-acetyltransferase complex protein AlgI